MENTQTTNGTTEPLRLNLDLLGSYIQNRADERAIVREKVAYHPDDLKRLLMRLGQARCRDRQFVIDEHCKFVYENIFKWVIGDETMLAINPYTGKVESGSMTKGIYIAGPTGTGKTMCLNVFRDLLTALGTMVSVPGYGKTPLAWKTFFATDLVAECLDYGDVRWVQKYPVICIQDVGAEQKEVVYMGNRIDTIGQILQQRGETSYLTMITSNDRISEEKYGERVASRLCQMCNYFELRGRDRRKS